MRDLSRMAGFSFKIELFLAAWAKKADDYQPGMGTILWATSGMFSGTYDFGKRKATMSTRAAEARKGQRWFPRGTVVLGHFSPPSPGPPVWASAMDT